MTKSVKNAQNHEEGEMGDKNCWEAQNCDLALRNKCPAHPDHGRECWRIAGTFCRGKQQGTPEEKKEFCLFDCGFPEKVARGEA